MELGVLQSLQGNIRSVFFNDWTETYGFYWPASGNAYGGVFQITRITGADGSEVRAPTLNRPQRDGGIAFPFYRGGRQFTLEGIIIPHNPGRRWKMEQHLKIVAQSFLRTSLGNATYRWLPPCDEQCALDPDDRFGDEGWMMIRCFLSGPMEMDMDTTATRSFAIPLYSPDPYALSVEQVDATFTCDQSQTMTNAGTAPTWPEIHVDGNGATQLAIANGTSDPDGFYEALQLVLTKADGLPSGIVINMQDETITDGSGNSLLRYLEPTGSDFWQLYPGDNVINCTSTGASASGTFYWRYAWV